MQSINQNNFLRAIAACVLLGTLTITASYLYADDTDIYLASGGSGSKPYLMMAMDYRQDLSGPYCKTTGPAGEQCLNLLDTPETFSLLQALDAMVNGGPSGAADGDSDGDGLRDSAADMTAFEASKIQALIAVTQAVFSQFSGIYVGMKIPNNDGGGTLLRGYREFLSMDLDGDAEDDPGYQTEIHTSIDEAVLGQDLNGDGDALDVLTAVSEAAVDEDINYDGDKTDTITESYPGAGGFVEWDINGAKNQLITILQMLPLPSQGNDYHESQPKEMHYEWYRYINGGAIEFGDQTANNFQGTNNPPPDTQIASGGSYVSPFASNPSDFECTKFYEIYATSGNEGGSDADLAAEITADLDADSAANYEDMVAYMSNNDILTIVDGDQTLKTWIIQVGDSAAFADDWAEAAGTEDQYMSVAKGASLADLKATLESAFIEALSVSATFVSASVPVNVFNRIQTLDNFYIALFEARDTERWPGNVKKLKLKDSDADDEFDDIVDALDNSAFSDADGRIKFEALTFWTDSANLPTADPDKGEINGRDGRSVDRGGAGQRIPGFIADDVKLSTSIAGARQLYVEPVSGSAFDEFNANNATAATLETLLGAADTNEAEALIAWARGVDVDDEDNDNDDDDVRPWLMGDAIHSRPLALNYGATGGNYTTDNPQIRLFMGTNAGFFHIIENTGSGGSELGEEVFAFIPRESLSIIKTLRADDGSNNPHPYGVDGAPVALVVDDDNDGTIELGDEVYVYVGMRRGGKSYYALDVSDPSATPTLKWKITKTSGGDFDELGLTFSTPRVAKVKYESTARDVLIFAGGYDLQKDGDTGTGRNADTEGNAIYIVDARTGALVWKAIDGSGTATDTVYQQSDLDHSIPSAVSTLDSNGNGVVDRLYVGDTSGIIWRVDLPEGDVANHRRDNWEITKLADVDDADESEDRRFFHPPDIVQTKDGSGSYDGILIETGDRASPLETTDDNQLYLIKDRNVTSGNPSATIIDEDSLPNTTSCVTGNETGCNLLDYSLGWKIDLAAAGEKGLASPLVASGKVFFTSYTPNSGSDSCAPSEGEGKLYVVNLGDGTAVYESGRDFDIGPGIPPGVTVIGDDTLIIPGTGVADPDDPSAVDKSKLLQTGGKSFFIYYWREKDVDYLE